MTNYSARDLMVKERADNLGAFLLLQLSEQGRPVETVAQFIASWWLSGDLDSEAIVDEGHEIRERVIQLMLHPEEVWDGLLVGSQVPLVDMFAVIGMSEFGEIESHSRMLKEVQEAFAQNYDVDDALMDYEQRLEAIGRILRPMIDPGDHIMNMTTTKTGDQFEYHVSIIVNPNIRHDDPNDILLSNKVYYRESVLDLAEEVIRLIDRNQSDFPEEEQAAHIVNLNKSGDVQRWLMTWDQARAIMVLNEARSQLEELAGDFGILWDEQFQGIQDMMAMAGAEYAGGF